MTTNMQSSRTNKRQSVNMFTMMALYRKINNQVMLECFRNVVRTNDSKKLSYCKPS